MSIEPGLYTVLIIYYIIEDKKYKEFNDDLPEFQSHIIPNKV
jgi:hypothetical protein